MGRLTTKTSIMGRKHDIAYGCASIWKKKLINDKYELIENVVDKLGQLENIEEELGIDLITLFKVLGNGLYYKTDYGTIEFANIDRLTFVEGINEYAFEKINGCQCGTNSSNKNWWSLNREVFLLKDFGIKSALTKEELES